MKINGNEIFSLQEIIRSDDGVDDMDAEKYFSYSGCSNCNDNLGNDVYDCKAWFWENEATREADYYEVKICNSCLCAYHNGEGMDEDCQNIYEI